MKSLIIAFAAMFAVACGGDNNSNTGGGDDHGISSSAESVASSSNGSGQISPSGSSASSSGSNQTSSTSRDEVSSSSDSVSSSSTSGGGTSGSLPVIRVTRVVDDPGSGTLVATLLESGEVQTVTDHGVSFTVSGAGTYHVLAAMDDGWPLRRPYTYEVTVPPLEPNGPGYEELRIEVSLAVRVAGAYYCSVGGQSSSVLRDEEFLSTDVNAWGDPCTNFGSQQYVGAADFGWGLQFEKNSGFRGHENCQAEPATLYTFSAEANSYGRPTTLTTLDLLGGGLDVASICREDW